MPTTDCATDIAPPDLSGADAQSVADSHYEAPQRPSSRASKPLRGLLFGFTATVVVGLAMASWYLGVRILDAGEVALPSAARGESVNFTPVPPPAAAPPPAAPQLSAPPVASPEVSAVAQVVGSNPSSSRANLAPAEIYLQVASLSPRQDAEFVRSLRAKGFRAQIGPKDVQSGDPEVQSGPKEPPSILIGPYSTHTALKQAQRKLQSGGVLAIETAY
jgi:hypothetical protein